MKQLSETLLPPEALELGRWIGQRESFALVAGQCNAAEVASLKKLRDSRLYRKVCKSWNLFCPKYLKVSRRQVDKLIALLDEFGPDYFVITQMTHVTVDEYRALAPHVTEKGLVCDGAPIALIPENSDQVAAGIAAILEKERPAQTAAAPSEAAVLKRFTAAIDALCELQGQISDGKLRRQFAHDVERVVREGGKRGVGLGYFV